MTGFHLKTATRNITKQRRTRLCGFEIDYMQFKDIHWWTGIFVQAIFRKNILTCHSGTKEILEIIDTLFESPIIELLEFGKRMGMTPPYELPHPLE